MTIQRAEARRLYRKRGQAAQEGMTRDNSEDRGREAIRKEGARREVGGYRERL